MMEGKGSVFKEEQINDIVYWANSGESMTATAAFMDLTTSKFIRDVRKAGNLKVFSLMAAKATRVKPI